MCWSARAASGWGRAARDPIRRMAQVDPASMPCQARDICPVRWTGCRASRVLAVLDPPVCRPVTPRWEAPRPCRLDTRQLVLIRPISKSENTRMKRVAVLGGGPAGAFAAERLARAGLETVVLD